MMGSFRQRRKWCFPNRSLPLRLWLIIRFSLCSRGDSLQSGAAKVLERGFPMPIRSTETVRRGSAMPRALIFAILIPLALALAACGTTQPKSSTPIKQGGGIYKVGTPYQINGIWYYPAENEKYDSTGIASWYGPQFHGKLTANGEVFDENQLSAAHPTLPMPVLARVTNLENGKSLIVRVNDRGPFVAGREIDMSKKAAELLGFMQKGTAKVRVQYVGRAPLDGGIGNGRGVAETFVAPPVVTPKEERKVTGVAPVTAVAAVSTTALPAPPGMSSAPQATMQPIPDKPVTRSSEAVDLVPVTDQGNIYVQAGAFQNLQNAEAVKQELTGVGRVEIQTMMVDGLPYYRVRVGPLTDVPAADSSLQNVIAHGHKGARIVVD